MGKSLVSCFFDSRCALHLHAQTLREYRTRSCGDVLADRQTDRHTDKQTRSSQYSVPGFFLVRRVHPDH